MDPVESKQPSDNNSQTPKDQKKIIILIVILVAALAAALIYWLLQDKPRTNPTQQPQAALKPAQVSLKPFGSGFANPTAIVSTNQPDDQRLFVLDRSGFIQILNSDGSKAKELFLDIASKVLADGEMGLLGLAFSPDYAKDGNFFINYIDKSQNTVIVRYNVSTDKNKADPASAKTLLTFKQPYANHNGGDLVFGPDGYLYVAVGDGGSGGDPEDRAQNLNSLFGKILRLDVSEIPYKIPTTNPFVNQAGTLPEIWAYGLRNPWRISFDRATRNFYVADVGQGELEEVNVEEAPSKGGVNYGWRCYEGSKEFNLKGCQAKQNYVFPAFEYDHNDGRCSITGGYVYRGEKYPALKGKYFYGDFCNGELYSAHKEGDKYKPSLVLKSSYQISTFGQDSDGELYLADFATGNIYQIQDAAN